MFVRTVLARKLAQEEAKFALTCVLKNSRDQEMLLQQENEQIYSDYKKIKEELTRVVEERDALRVVLRMAQSGN